MRKVSFSWLSVLAARRARWLTHTGFQCSVLSKHDLSCGKVSLSHRVSVCKCLLAEKMTCYAVNTHCQCQAKVIVITQLSKPQRSLSNRHVTSWSCIVTHIIVCTCVYVYVLTCVCTPRFLCGCVCARVWRAEPDTPCAWWGQTGTSDQWMAAIDRDS